MIAATKLSADRSKLKKAGRFELLDYPGKVGAFYSSGIPALRRPAKYVASNRVWIFGADAP